MRAFRVGPTTEIASFFAYSPLFRGGVFVGAVTDPSSVGPAGGNHSK